MAKSKQRRAARDKVRQERARAHDESVDSKAAFSGINEMTAGLIHTRKILAGEGGGKLSGFLWSEPKPSQMAAMMLKGAINACVECGGRIMPVVADLDGEPNGMVVNLGEGLAVGLHTACASTLDNPEKRVALLQRISENRAGGVINSEGGAANLVALDRYVRDWAATLGNR